MNEKSKPRVDYVIFIFLIKSLWILTFNIRTRGCQSHLSNKYVLLSVFCSSNLPIRLFKLSTNKYLFWLCKVFGPRQKCPNQFQWPHTSAATDSLHLPFCFEPFLSYFFPMVQVDNSGRNKIILLSKIILTFIKVIPPSSCIIHVPNITGVNNTFAIEHFISSFFS